MEARLKMLLRLVATAAIVAAAAWAIPRYCMNPLACNRMELSLEQQTIENYERMRGSYRGVAAARQLADITRLCSDHVPYDANMRFLTATNYRVVERWEDAVAEYRLALTYDRRPELYIGAGNALVHAGRRDEALRMFLAAGYFRLESLADVEDPLLAEDSRREVEAYLTLGRSAIPPQRALFEVPK